MMQQWRSKTAAKPHQSIRSVNSQLDFEGKIYFVRVYSNIWPHRDKEATACSVHHNFRVRKWFGYTTIAFRLIVVENKAGRGQCTQAEG